jgi:catechol 2,3-dioxygenase-like lactoylglutathione lyase family enzyme
LVHLGKKEPAMIDHIGIDVSDFARARAFYDAALAPLGATFLAQVPEEFTGGVKVGGYGMDRPTFWISEGAAQTPAVHIAFAARDRAAVDAFHAAALAAGGTDNGRPGLRPQYHPDYYGAFVLDPDGNNIEAVCHRPAQE